MPMLMSGFEISARASRFGAADLANRSDESRRARRVSKERAQAGTAASWRLHHITSGFDHLARRHGAHCRARPLKQRMP
jgi:hypothetical protein